MTVGRQQADGVGGVKVRCLEEKTSVTFNSCTVAHFTNILGRNLNTISIQQVNKNLKNSASIWAEEADREQTTYQHFLGMSAAINVAK